MKLSILLTLILASAAGAAEPAAPKTLLAQPDKLLFSDDFNSAIDAKNWKGAKGKWEIVNGALQGAEKPEDKHPATFRHAMTLPNFVLSMEIKLDGAKVTSISINDAKEHVARVMLTPAFFQVRRDDHDHEGPDKPVMFLQKAMKTEAGKWHTVVIEMVGDTMVATLDDQITGFGSDELFKVEKANPGFTVSGQSASFRNFRIWSAKPEPKATWAETKAKLPTK